TLVSGRFGHGGNVWIHAAGWWLVLSTLNLHTLAASFARTRLLDFGVSNLRRRLIVLSVVALLAAAVLRWVKSSVPAPEASDFASIEALKYYLRHALESGPALYALIPFRLIARPYLAPDAAAFLAAFIPAAVCHADTTHSPTLPASADTRPWPAATPSTSTPRMTTGQLAYTVYAAVV